MNPLVSVIIPCRNEEKTIHLVLEALFEQSFPLQNMEIVIADGLSTDGTRRAIHAFSEAHPALFVRLVDNPKQIIPTGLNTAIKASKGELIVRMDAHSLPNQDYVQRCYNAHQEGKAENVGGVWKISPQNNGWVARSIAAAAANPFAVGDAHYRFTEKAAYVDTVPYGSYKRELFEKIGYFDESLLANEDYEFNTRIRQSGGRIWLDPAIQCTYFARATFAALAKQYWGYGFWKAQMLKRYPETLRWRQALPPAFVLGLVVLALVGFVWPIAWPVFAIIVGLYLAVQLVPAIQISLKAGDIHLSIGVVIATLIMHFSWGTALIVGLFSHPDRK
ncbi:MAG: glycosyltransferase family 2 protein [Chloroflexi bacterium]|nr:glycosyltransferase family 2 protein [Chloroflexota bacterium]